VGGPVRELSPAGDGLHRRESRRATRSGGNGHGSGTREPPQEPSVPDYAAPGVVAASTVFPRRQRRHDRGRRGALRPRLGTRTVGCAKSGSSRIPEVALGNVCTSDRGAGGRGGGRFRREGATKADSEAWSWLGQARPRGVFRSTLACGGLTPDP